jgi:hypothetical protein
MLPKPPSADSGPIQFAHAPMGLDRFRFCVDPQATSVPTGRWMIKTITFYFKDWRKAFLQQRNPA